MAETEESKVYAAYGMKRKTMKTKFHHPRTIKQHYWQETWK
jgi:hypothetical protein